jgi:hypothetical protein
LSRWATSDDQSGPVEWSELKATISDPNVWTRPYTIRYPFKLEPEYKLYEYACHEGNYMMTDALTGARDLEKQGKATKVDRGTVGNPGPSPAAPQ